MGRLQNDRRRYAGVERFLPAAHTQTPAVPRLKSLKAEFGVWGDEVVSSGMREFEELRGHDSTDSMKTKIARSRPAEAVPIESRERILAAALQASPKNVRWHGSTIREIRFAGS